MEAIKEKTTAIKSTEAAKRIRPLTRWMYRSAHEAKEKGQSVAYCMSLSMTDEIIRAMDIVPIWTEHYAGLCAAKRASERFTEQSDAEGFSNVICGYARNGLGFDIMRYQLGEIPPDSPDGGMARPDVLIASSRGCDTSIKWFQALGRYLDVPIFNIEVLWPPKDANIKEIKERYIKYMVKELEELVTFLEKQTNRKMDWERLESIVAVADETQHLWWEVSQLRKAIPCPMPTEDHANSMVPFTFLLGTQEALDFYKELYNEIKNRVDNKIGAIPEERYRLMWGIGLPPWHTLRVFNHFESHGAVGVKEYFYKAWESPNMLAIPNDIHPLEHIVRRNLESNVFNHERAKVRCGEPVAQYLLDWIDEYKITGFVEHMSTSCRLWSVGQLHYANIIRENRKDFPILIWSSDMIDIHTFDETQVKAQIDAFIGVMDSYKRRRV